MSNFSWTEEQLRAIDSRGKNLLVSAAAGSGKTALLTERLKRIVLKDKIDSSRILVLTFTRAAASEMKQRFKTQLYNALTEEGWNISEKEILHQIELLTDSYIGTIDSFAQTMVRKYFQIAGVDPAFRIGDQTEIDLLISEAMDEVFEELFLKNEEAPDDLSNSFVELIDYFGGRRRNDALKDVLIQLNSFLDSLEDPNAWIKRFTDDLDSISEDNLYEIRSLEPFIQNIRDTVNHAGEVYDEIKFINDDIPWKKGKSKENFEAEIGDILALREYKDPKDLVNALKGLNFGRVTFPRNIAPEIKEEIEALRGKSGKGIRDELKKISKDLQSRDIDNEIENLKELNRIFKNLVTVNELVLRRINEKKAQNQILYFNDLERGLLKILENEKVREDIKNQFDYIFLDEVQDTNSLQEAIISKIEQNNNRFMVGDFKQSIYNFRNADPTILKNKFDEYQNDENSEVVLLNRNFRSSPSVIDAVNSIFEKIMTDELGGINYNDDSKLIAFREDPTVKAEIDIIDLKSLEENSEELEDDKVEIQARFIARKIKKLVDDKKADFKDILVLYRSINKIAKKILKIFSDEGIPVVFEGINEEVDTIEISVFLKFLNLIDNHKQDIPLLAVMELPIFNFSLDDLTKIRLEYPDSAYLYQAVEDYMNEKDDELADHLKDFYHKLDKWREMSKHSEIDDYLWELLLESNFFNYFGNLENGNDRKRNLRLLVDKAKDFKSTSLKGITSFLQYVKKLEKQGQSISNLGSITDSINAVHLMSIHKSKGLEFPVVFLADISHQFNIRNDGPYYLNKEYGFGSDYYALVDNVISRQNSILNDSLKYQHKKELLSEEMRLLYVALTRAKDQLILVGTSKDAKKDIEKWREGVDYYNLSKSLNFLNWLMGALYNDKSLRSNDNTASTNYWDINYISDISDYNLEEEPEEDRVDEDYLKLREQIYSQLNKEQRKIINNKPRKMSVSRIKKYGIDDEEIIDLVPLNEVEDKVSSAEIGTGVHRILQLLDFEAFLESEDYNKELNRQVENFVEKGLIDEDLLDIINFEVVLNFLDSDVGQRVLNTYRDNKDKVLKEMPFLYDIDINELIDSDQDFRPIELSGIIDLCFLEDDQWVILDYKTDRYFNQSQWEKRLDEYALQIELYGKALADLSDLPIKEKHLVFLTEGQDIVYK